MNQNYWQMPRESYNDTEKLPAEVMQAMFNVGNVIAGGDMAILKEVQDVKNELSKLYSKPRKSMETSGLVTATNKCILVQHFYSDGSVECEPCILNVAGPWIVKRLSIDGRRSSLRMIIFENGGKPVDMVFDSDKTNPQKLYELFIKKGFWFSNNMRMVKISEILYATFCTDIVGTELPVDVASLAGWHEKVYANRKTFFFFGVPELEKYPSASATLTEGILERDTVISYAERINQITSESDRVLIALFPFTAILSSVFLQAGYREKVALNIVLGDKASMAEVVEMFKIVNRGVEGAVDATLSKKQLEQATRCVKDDVLIVDAILRTASAYDKKKVKANVERLLEELTGKRSCSYSGMQKSCAIIADYLVVDSNVCNVTWNISKRTEKLDRYKQDFMGVVFSEFIHYIESRYDQVAEVLNGHKSKNEQKIAMLEVTYRIFIDFFKVKGYSGMSILGIKAHPDFAKLIVEHQLDFEGLGEYFVKMIRKAALKFKFANMEELAVTQQTVIYNEEFLWIPSSLMRSVLRENGLEKHMTIILTHLRDESILKTKGEGMTVRFRDAEWYKLRRDFFNKSGLADIVDLGEVLV